MNLTEILPRIYLVKYPTQYELTSTFMRLQEFYESPFENIRNKHFSYEEFFDSYSKNGKLTYWSDWVGFNVPGDICTYFYWIFNDELTKRENELFKHIYSLQNINKKDFYIIGIYRNQDLSHETAHALYYLNQNYKREANKLVAALSPKEFNKRCQELATSLYTPEVFIDEIQAYGVSNKERPFLALYNKYRTV